MFFRILRTTRPQARLLLFCALLVLAGSPAVRAQSLKDTMLFAADMAERGSWREARYRWEQASRERPDDPKLWNNLAVAHEVMGEIAQARELYRKAALAAAGDPAVQENVRRFTHFWRQVWDQEDGDGSPLEVLTRGEAREAKQKSLGKTVRVTVALPVPARLKLTGNERLLVTSFLGGENNLMDTNRELVRFLRAEFNKDTELDVLDINPPPAVPEQTVEDLLANLEFWRYLGRNYDTDLIVSGVVEYDRRDVSSFEDVDVISSRTGQKVRQSQFVEQEQFVYEIDLFFIDGKTGQLLFRDRLQRGALFRGSQNDPISAFYSLSDSIAADVLAVVTMRVRQDTRLIFKK